MSINPLFSVLIANYNNGKYLMDAIESVRRQTYQNWEIILVDDGSTDESKELYKELEKDERIHIYLNDKNYGCGYTKRRCAELANGELCGFLDPDDAITSNALQVMVDEHISNPDASLVYSTYYKCDDLMRVESVNTSARTLPANTDYLHYNLGAVHAFATFKTSCYRLTKGLNPTFQRAIDQNLYYLLEEQGELVFHNEPLYYYRFHNNSISLNDNVVNARYWHLIAIYEACIRRGIVDESEKIAVSLLNLYVGDVSSLRKELNKYRFPTVKIVFQIVYRWFTTLFNTKN